MRLGIDIGRVIIGPVVCGRADTSFLGSRLEDAIHTPPAQGAFDAIRQLVDRCDGAVWLVSKCGENVQRKSRAWLQHHDFYARTGLPEPQLEFCLRRGDKAPIARRLGLTAFVDDRRDVLAPMRAIVPRLLLFGEQDRLAPEWTEPVGDWPAVLRALL